MYSAKSSSQKSRPRKWRRKSVDLPSKAYAPRGVGLHPHEVLGAPERVERDGEPRGGYPKDVVRVQRAARVLHDIAHDLRDPEGVEEQQDVLEQAVQPVHDQDAAQQEAVCEGRAERSV